MESLTGYQIVMSLIQFGNPLKKWSLKMFLHQEVLNIWLSLNIENLVERTQDSKNDKEHKI